MRVLLSSLAAVVAALTAVPPAAAAPQGCGPPLAAAPARGKAVQLKALGASFRLPEGWRGQWATGDDGSSVYQIVAAGAEDKGGFAFSLTAVGPEDRDRSLEELAREAVAELAAALTGGAGEAPALGKPTRFAAGKHCGAHAVFPFGPFEGNLAAVRAGDLLYVLLGAYDPGAGALIRPGALSLLATLTVAPPPRNAALERKIQGCWSRSQASTGLSGSASAGASLSLAADGTYRAESYSTVSVPGAGSGVNRDQDAGRWMVVADQLVLASQRGRSSARAVQLAGGRLVVGGAPYLPCR